MAASIEKSRLTLLRESNPELWRKATDYPRRAQYHAGKQPIVIAERDATPEMITANKVLLFHGVWYGSDSDRNPFVGFGSFSCTDGTVYLPMCFSRQSSATKYMCTSGA